MTIKNWPASVRARLLNISRATARPYAELLQYYAIERFLYRLGESKHRSRFILKGALMFHAWGAPLSRSTKDIDLLGYTDNAVENLVAIVQEICAQSVEPDGMIFDREQVRGQRIKEGAEYEGVRLRFLALLGKARIHMQVDVGFADVVIPHPITVDYPTILEMAGPQLRGYSRETVVAEKVHAMVVLGTLNSRMKDFYDVWLLAHHFDFEGIILQEAIRQTFSQRKTAIPQKLPVAFSDQFARDKQNQWQAFLRRTRLDLGFKEFDKIINDCQTFLFAPLNACATNKQFDKRWQAGKSWK
jgi:predicted nucleotidyltransferase component of viral defense system